MHGRGQRTGLQQRIVRGRPTGVQRQRNVAATAKVLDEPHGALEVRQPRRRRLVHHAGHVVRLHVEPDKVAVGEQEGQVERKRTAAAPKIDQQGAVLGPRMAGPQAGKQRPKGPRKALDLPALPLGPANSPGRGESGGCRASEGRIPGEPLAHLSGSGAWSASPGADLGLSHPSSSRKKARQGSMAAGTLDQSMGDPSASAPESGVGRWRAL